MSSAEQAAAGRSAGLEPYSPSLAFMRLAVGVDNIRYDVFLSPHWQEQASQYLFEQVLHYAQPHLRHLYPSDARSRSAAATEFKRRLGQVLQEALNQAKEKNNIEIDLLARLAVIKWLVGEMPRQFSQLAVACRERAEKKTSLHVPGSMDAFVARSKIADYQASRRHIVRAVGEGLFQLLEELEENTLRPGRKALFGTDFPDLYGVGRNRLTFVENPNDAVIHLEQYVMLGHFKADVDREDWACEALIQLLRDQGLALVEGEELARLEQQRDKRVDELQEASRRLREAELALEELAPRPAGGRPGFGWLDTHFGGGRPTVDPADLQQRVEAFEAERTRLVQEVEELERRSAFLRQTQETQFSELLSNPANAEHLFGTVSPTGAAEPRTPAQEALLRQLYTRLERNGMVKFILASYLVRSIYKEFCPPLNPQQLKHAVVGRQGWNELETLLDQFPTHNFPLQKLEEVGRRLRRLTRTESETLLVRFARDLTRLRRDLLHRQLLTTAMEKIHLVAEEKTRHVSRLNGTLYEFLLADEREAGEERVVTHAVVKADVRDSTRITEELLRRGLNPATHFSSNFYEPVRKLLERYSASKIFIEGDALILGIYETESNRAFQRPVAKACLLAKEIILVCQAYNERARANDLPVLELGVGIAFQNSAPHYWADGDSRILISAALNNSDRLASCTKMARKLFSGNSGWFRVFYLQGYPPVGTAEEVEEFFIRYNVMGVALNEEGFQKLRQEISLHPVQTSEELLGHKAEVTLYCGTVPLGQSFEKLIIREARVPRLRLPGHEVEEWTERLYYEVCVAPQLYQRFPGTAG